MKNLSIVALLSVFLMSCAPSIKLAGQRNKVGDSGGKPSWVKEGKDTWENKNKLFFRIVVPQQYDFSMGLEAAKAMAFKDLTEQVYVKISSELGYSMLGNSSREGASGKYLKSAIAIEAQSVEVYGLSSEETYWERFEEYKYSSVSYNYDIYRSFSVDKSAIAEARQRVLDRALNMAKAATDTKAEEELNKLFEKNK